MTTKERAHWLAWTRVRGLGPVILKRIAQEFESMAGAWHARESELLKVSGFGPSAWRSFQALREELDPEAFLAQHLKDNPQFWTPADPDYPQLLLEIPDTPPVLYYRGVVTREENQGIKPMVAMVGTRHPTEHGQQWAEKISVALARRGVTVVSGLAKGIDGICHRGALAGGDRTIGVLGTGLDRVYPPENRVLFEEIPQRGLLITEYPRGIKPERGNFPARNRIIAGLCRAMIVVEAPERSGSLITAYRANEFNRDVYTVPDSPNNLQARGCLGLIQRGGTMIVTLEDFLDSLAMIPPLDGQRQLSLFGAEIAAAAPPMPPPDLRPDLLAIWQLLTPEPQTFDAIVAQCDQDGGTVSGALLELELEGLVTQLPGMRYALPS